MHLITALKYIRKMLTDLKGGMVKFTVIVVLFVGDFVLNLLFAIAETKSN